MRNLFLSICTAMLLMSCSKDDGPATMEAKEYGIYVVSNIDSPIEFNYKFYDYGTGEVYHQGITTTSNGTVLFPVTDKEKPNGSVVVDIIVDNPTQIDAFYISKNGNYYLNGEDNPNATSIFEMNDVRYLSEREVFEGAIELKRDESYWRNSSDWSNN